MAFTAGAILTITRAGRRASTAPRLPSPVSGRPVARRGDGGERRRTGPALVAATAAVALAAGAGLATTAAAAAGAIVVCLAHHHRTSRRSAAAATGAVPEACRVLSTHLRAGSSSVEALVAAAATSPPHLAKALLSGATAERLGSSVAAALRSSDFGAGALWPVALCWQVCGDTGAALGSTLDRLAAVLSAEREARETVDAELAGARLSAAVMAGLPIIGLLMGTAFGARPIDFLLNTQAGIASLVVAVVLDAAGWYWVQALGTRAAR
ncbi:MAG: type II secretion system F family protein [Mycobacteriales bacterium]